VRDWHRTPTEGLTRQQGYPGLGQNRYGLLDATPDTRYGYQPNNPPTTPHMVHALPIKQATLQAPDGTPVLLGSPASPPPARSRGPATRNRAGDPPHELPTAGRHRPNRPVAAIADDQGHCTRGLPCLNHSGTEHLRRIGQSPPEPIS